MLTRNPRVTESVERQYTVGRDLAFSQIVSDRVGPGDDDALAELIEADGRARIALKLPVSLSRYLDAVPDLADRPVPLDAAIDVVLRCMSTTPRPSKAAVEQLISQHPRLESPIREAAALADAVWSTTGLHQRVQRPTRLLPCEFGPPLPSGSRRYQLRSLLGSGGSGDVYLAADRQLSEQGHEALVAIKVLAGDRGPWARQRLIDEATKARRVTHANVVRVLDRGVSEDDEDFVVYEHVAGGDLGEWLSRRAAQLSVREAASLMSRIARGVHAAHAAGLVHCDLKPGNVLMTPEGEPKVADFGIAVRAGDGPSPDVTDRDQPVGNIAFIAPEQFRMEDGCFSIGADVYALGGMLYHLVCGQLPNGQTRAEIGANHDSREGRAMPPRLVGADGDLAAVCSRAMTPAPDRRHSSAAAFADDLDAWLRLEPIHWLRPGPIKRAMLWSRRRPAVVAAAGVAVLMAGVGAAASSHWSRIAEQKTVEARKVTGTLRDAQSFFRDLRKRVVAAARQGMYQDLIPPEMMLEWMRGQPLLGDPRERKPHEARIELVKGLIEQRNLSGFSRSVETRMWETLLGLYLLDIRRYEEAEPLMVSCRNAWVEAQRGDDDPWLLQIDRLIAVARAQRILGQASAVARSAEANDELALIADALSPVLELDPSSADHGCITELAISTLVEIYGPTVLNNPGKHQAAAARDNRRRSRELK